MRIRGVAEFDTILHRRRLAYAGHDAVVLTERVTHILETLSHPQGVIVVGWVAPRVLYARFLESLPATLAIRYAFHLRHLLASEECVRYFADASELESYEPRSADVIRNVFAVHRHRFASIDIASANRRMDLLLNNFSSSIGGGLVQVSDVVEFNTRLTNAAPRCQESLNPRTWRSIPPVSLVPPSK